MGSCHPKDRVMWRELQKYAEMDSGRETALGQAIRCAEEYLEEYTHFAEARPTDGQVESLFQTTHDLIDEARKSHWEGHMEEIDRGKGVVEKAKGIPGCDLRADLSTNRKINDCMEHKGRGGNGYNCDPASIKREEEYLEEAKLNGCWPWPKKDDNKCMLLGYALHRLQDTKRHVRAKPICEEMGCTKENVDRWKKELHESPCTRAGLDADDALHYFVDKQLKELGVKASDAKTRLDMVLVIEEFVQMQHHRGTVLDFACDFAGTLGPETLDILDCLAGYDWEKV